MVWSAAYTAFGEALVDASSTIENNLRFPGQYYDAETGLHYNWNRYYDPATGRYTQTDPIGFAAGDFNLFRYVDSVGKPPIETNLYQYALNNPLKYVDPLGLEAGLGGGGTGLDLNPQSGCGPNWGKVKTGIALQFAGYGFGALGGYVIFTGYTLAPASGGWGAVAATAEILHATASGGGILATGGFFWWEGYNLIKEGFAECGCEAK